MLRRDDNIAWHLVRLRCPLGPDREIRDLDIAGNGLMESFEKSKVSNLVKKALVVYGPINTGEFHKAYLIWQPPVMMRGTYTICC
jgi:hypothetical protein